MCVSIAAKKRESDETCVPVGEHFFAAGFEFMRSRQIQTESNLIIMVFGVSSIVFLVHIPSVRRRFPN